MKKFLFALMLCLSPNGGFSGHENGNSGGTLARLLSYAHREIIITLPNLPPKMLVFQSPKLTEWYADHFVQMTEDIKHIQFAPMNKKIFDSYYDYESWIRLNTTSGFVIEYNPEVSLYQKLVGAINPRYRGVRADEETTPSILDVTEYLLHEIGHKYGLNEHDAWMFAQTLIKYFRFVQPIPPLYCRAMLTDSGNAKLVEKNIVLSPENPSHSFKVGMFGLELKLNQKLYQTIWRITAQKPFGDIGIHEFEAVVGSPLSGRVTVQENDYAYVDCRL